MKSKIVSFLMALTALFALAGMSACSSTSTTTAAQALANFKTGVVDACTVLTSTTTAAQGALTGLTTVQQAVFTEVATDITTLCSDTSTISTTSVTTFISTSIPLLEAGINASTLPTSTKNTVNAGLVILAAALSSAVAIYENSTGSAVTTTSLKAPVFK